MEGFVIVIQAAKIIILVKMQPIMLSLAY